MVARFGMHLREGGVSDPRSRKYGETWGTPIVGWGSHPSKVAKGGAARGTSKLVPFPYCAQVSFQRVGEICELAEG